jgi:uncharacterized protein (DUF1330 family)
MTTYCVGQAKNINKDALMKYREHAPAALKKHGGSVIISTTNLTALEGSTDHNDSVVLLSFPSEEAAKNWRYDEELSHVHDLRNACADWTIQILGTPK